MRILFVAPGLPYPPDTGGRTRTLNLLKWLSERHEICLVSLLHEDEDPSGIDSFRAYCSQVITVRPESGGRSCPPPFRRQIAWRTLTPCRSASLASVIAGLGQEGFAVAHLDNLGLAPLVHRLGTIPTVLGKQDLEWVVMQRLAMDRRLSPVRRWRTYRAARRLRRYELDVCRQFAAVITVSEHDARLLKTGSPTSQVAVVPNGVDTDYFQPVAEGACTPELLFAGSMFWSPNVQAIEHFCEAILPTIRRSCPDIRLSIVGQGAPESVLRLAVLPGVSVIGRVEDLRPFYARASVCVVPLQSGSGTRLRILEAMAMARPVVSTTVGAEGLAVRDGEHLLIANTPEDFAQSVLSLLGNLKLGLDLGRRARALVEEIYNWSGIAAKLEEVYLTVQEQRR